MVVPDIALRSSSVFHHSSLIGCGGDRQCGTSFLDPRCRQTVSRSPGDSANTRLLGGSWLTVSCAESWACRESIHHADWAYPQTGTGSLRGLVGAGSGDGLGAGVGGAGSGFGVGAGFSGWTLILRSGLPISISILSNRGGRLHLTTRDAERRGCKRFLGERENQSRGWDRCQR